MEGDRWLVEGNTEHSKQVLGAELSRRVIRAKRRKGALTAKSVDKNKGEEETAVKGSKEAEKRN